MTIDVFRNFLWLIVVPVILGLAMVCIVTATINSEDGRIWLTAIVLLAYSFLSPHTGLQREARNDWGLIGAVLPLVCGMVAAASLTFLVLT